MFRAAVASLAVMVASAFTMKLPELPTLNQKNALGAVSICSSGSALAKNLIATTNVTSPKVGDFVGLTFEYDIASDFSGTQKYDCTINGFLPYSTSNPMCGQSKADPCPKTAGHRVDIGGIEVVSGVSKLKCTINWVDENGSEILCVTASWTVAAEAAAGSAYAL